MRPEDLPGARVLRFVVKRPDCNATSVEFKPALYEKKDLPMINGKKTSEFVETSLIYLLSAAVAVGAFVLVWLVSTLLASGQT